MKNGIKALRGACVALIAAATLFACTTVNKFDSYRVEGATVAVSLRQPPSPTLDIDYNVTVDFKNPVLTAISVGTNIVKANEASKLEPLMRDALASVDVPGIVFREAYTACISALDAYEEERKFDADYLLDLDIHQYGIDASSHGGAVSLSVRLTAQLFHNRSGELVWRRDFSIHKSASPVMFGFGDIVGNIVTASELASLSDQDLAKGFEQMARDTARSIARTLEDDLYSARFGD